MYTKMFHSPTAPNTTRTHTYIHSTHVISVIFFLLSQTQHEASIVLFSEIEKRNRSATVEKRVANVSNAYTHFDTCLVRASTTYIVCMLKIAFVRSCTAYMHTVGYSDMRKGRDGEYTQYTSTHTDEHTVGKYDNMPTVGDSNNNTHTYIYH